MASSPARLWTATIRTSHLGTPGPSRMQTISADNFIHLGDLIRLLFNPKGFSPDEIAGLIKQVDAYLTTQPFRHVRMYLEKLDQVRNWLENPKTAWSLSGEMPNDLESHFARIIEPLRSNIYSESKDWQTIILNQSAVSAKLRSLEGWLKFEDQKALLSDTIRCLECGAPRAAIAMGWSLTYEYLRRWVFVETGGRLATFNGLLTTKKRNKTDLYEPIAGYEQFQDLGERFVIDLLNEAKLIDKGPYQLLVDALNRRNHFAHPSFAKATDVSAAGYIENLIVNIFENAGFAY